MSNGPPLVSPHEGYARVPGKPSHRGQVETHFAPAGSQVRVYFIHGLAVEAEVRRDSAVRRREAHQRDADGSTIDHPRLVAPRVEDRPAARCPFERPAVRSATDRVGRDQSDPLRGLAAQAFTGLHKPVATQIGFTGHPALVHPEQSRDIFLAEVRDEQLPAQERWIPDHDVRIGPLRILAAGHQNRVTHSIVSNGSRIGSRAPANPFLRIHWISPIHTDTRASSAA